MVQTTLTQKFRRTNAEEVDSNVHQSDHNDNAVDAVPLNCVTPHNIRRQVTHPSEEEAPSEELIVSSQSTIELPSQDDEDTEELQFI